MERTVLRVLMFTPTTRDVTEFCRAPLSSLLAKAARASHFNADGTSGVLMGARLSGVWDLTWLCDVLVTPHTVVTTDSEPGG